MVEQVQPGKPPNAAADPPEEYLGVDPAAAAEDCCVVVMRRTGGGDWQIEGVSPDPAAAAAAVQSMAAQLCGMIPAPASWPWSPGDDDRPLADLVEEWMNRYADGEQTFHLDDEQLTAVNANFDRLVAANRVDAAGGPEC